VSRIDCQLLNRSCLSAMSDADRKSVGRSSSVFVVDRELLIARCLAALSPTHRTTPNSRPPTSEPRPIDRRHRYAEFEKYQSRPVGQYGPAALYRGLHQNVAVSAKQMQLKPSCELCVMSRPAGKVKEKSAAHSSVLTTAGYSCRLETAVVESRGAAIPFQEPHI